MSPIIAASLGLDLVDIPTMRLRSSLLSGELAIPVTQVTDLPIKGEFGHTVVPFLVATLDAKEIILGRPFTLLLSTMDTNTLPWLPVSRQTPQLKSTAQRFLGLVSERMHRVHFVFRDTEITPHSSETLVTTNALQLDLTTNTPNSCSCKPTKYPPKKPTTVALKIPYDPKVCSLSVELAAANLEPFKADKAFMTELREVYADVFDPNIARPVNGDFSVTIDLQWKPYPNNIRLRKAPYHLANTEQPELEEQIQGVGDQ